jgi:O-succinylbenzoic acid--CoA ligase
MKYKILTNNKDTVADFKRFLDDWNNESNSVHQYSSGSTGPPKLIEIPKWKLKASAQMTGDFFKFDKMSNCLLCISTNYIGGKMMVVRSTLFNLELFITDVSSNPIQELNEVIDFAAMVPLQVDTILKENPEKLDLIKHLIIGGAPVSIDIEKRLQKRKCAAYSTYGMTETVSHVALKKLNAKDSPFQAIGDTSFREKEGELIIDSPQLQITSLHTNDIVDLIDEQHFHWKGRKDFVINSGGIKIHPEVIEEKIKSILKESNFIVSSVKDVTYGEKIIVICERKDYAEIKNVIEDWSFDRYEKPKKIYIVDFLPKTKSGKIDRIATRDKITHD